MTERITINDADQPRDYTLEVDFDTLPGEEEIGYHGGIEVYGVRCTEISISCGSMKTGDYICVNMPQDEYNRERVGAWCQTHFREEIETAINDLVRHHEHAEAA